MASVDQAAYQADLQKTTAQDAQDAEAAQHMPDGEPAPRPLSKVQTFGLIATCTTAMMLNVSRRRTIPFSSTDLAAADVP